MENDVFSVNDVAGKLCENAVVICCNSCSESLGEAGSLDMYPIFLGIGMAETFGSSLGYGIAAAGI